MLLTTQLFLQPPLPKPRYFFNFTYISILPANMYVCNSCRDEEGIGSPGTQVTDSYSRPHAMLETEPESYGRAASNRNCWAISPALYCYWLQKQCSYMLWHISDITQLPLEWNYLYKLVNTVLCGNLTPTFNLTRKRFHMERKICAIMKLPSINLQKQNTLQRCVKLEYSPPIPTITNLLHTN